MGSVWAVVSRMGPHLLSVFCASDTVILQELIDGGKTFSMITVYVAAVACHTGFGDKTASQRALVCQFMRGACRHLSNFRPLTPLLDRGVFLEGFKGLPI